MVSRMQTKEKSRSVRIRIRMVDGNRNINKSRKDEVIGCKKEELRSGKNQRVGMKKRGRRR